MIRRRLFVHGVEKEEGPSARAGRWLWRLWTRGCIGPRLYERLVAPIKSPPPSRPRCLLQCNWGCTLVNVSAKEILAAIGELEAAGWRVKIASSRAHAYARAYCPGGPEGCPPLTIYGTPRVPENEAAKIRRALARCEHSGKETA